MEHVINCGRSRPDGIRELWAGFCALVFSAMSAKERNAPAPQARGREEMNRQAERLLDEYGGSMLRLAYSYLHNMSDAEEILQDALLHFLRAGPSVAAGPQEKAYLLRITANLSKNRISYNRLRAADALSEALAADGREDLSFVWEAVKSLPTPCREVIHLFYYEGYTTAQISRILQRKESTIRSDLHRGRARLKEILKEEYDFEEGL